MRKIKDGNVIYLLKKEKDSMDLRCSNCDIVKNEADITVVIDDITGKEKYRCECGCSTFSPQADLDELLV